MKPGVVIVAYSTSWAHHNQTEGCMGSLHDSRWLLRRELKRLKDEDDSRFSNCPMLPMAADARKPPRYLLCSLIGKGGFS